jgi:hypothetical protein
VLWLQRELLMPVLCLRGCCPNGGMRRRQDLSESYKLATKRSS